jgi:ABC-type amino acid transport substrate-binding protein
LLLWLVLASLSFVHIAAARPRKSRVRDRPHTPPAAITLAAAGILWDPYQYREYRHGVSILTGFDMEIERALARIIRLEIALPPMAWEEHLAALADGRADIAAGATASPARLSPMSRNLTEPRPMF